MLTSAEISKQNFCVVVVCCCHLMINTKKTKCMIFNSSGRLMKRCFYLNGVKLDMVRSYKYLGFVITPSGEISTGLQDLRDRAFKAYMKMKNDLGPSFNQDILTTLKLYGLSGKAHLIIRQ